MGMFALLTSEWPSLDAAIMANGANATSGTELYEGAPSKKTFDIERLPERYGISPREQDVLNLLIKGRAVPFICDGLFLAKSTVITHVKHIYKKTGITHGHQELLDIVKYFEGWNKQQQEPLLHAIHGAPFDTVRYRTTASKHKMSHILDSKETRELYWGTRELYWGTRNCIS